LTDSGIDGRAVVFQVLQEVGGEFVRDEFCRDARFRELDEVGVGRGEERFLAGAGGSGEVVGEAGLVLRDGAAVRPMFRMDVSEAFRIRVRCGEIRRA
jgi:hypothetical protein